MDCSTTYQPWNGSAILLMDLDAFFASVEQLDHPDWRGKPVIVGGDPTKRGVVSTASYEARTYGVHSAMAASQAAQLCPDAIWTPGNFARYKEVSAAVMEILLSESPHLQQVSIDEAFLDITPTPHNTEHPISIAQRIQQRVAELGVTCSIGLGTSKAIAKTASDIDKPRGITVVYPGREESFLSPLPTKVMSGIGPVAQKRLRALGINTLGEVALAPNEILVDIFGVNAERMRERCKGKDEAVQDEREAVKSISNEISFAVDVTSIDDLHAALTTVASKVCRRLRKHALKGRTLMLKIKYGDRRMRTMQKKLEDPVDNEFVVLDLLKEMLDELWVPGIPVRLLGCSLSGFNDDSPDDPVQTTLFNLVEEEACKNGPDEEKKQRLAQATDTVRDRFGENAVRFGGQMRTLGNITGSAAKNPEDYR